MLSYINESVQLHSRTGVVPTFGEVLIVNLSLSLLLLLFLGYPNFWQEHLRDVLIPAILASCLSEP